MTPDIKRLASSMLQAALPFLKKGVEDVKTFAEAEFLKIAQTIVTIQEDRAAGAIDEQQAAALLDMQTDASQEVLLGIEGLSLVAVEAAINAALQVAKTALNTALGFALIP